jgi:DNA replication protein DnaC
MTDQRTEQTQHVGPIAGPVAADFAKAWGIDYQPGAVDLDTVGAAYLAECKRRDCIARWEADCPAEYKSTDWQDARLMPYAAQIAKVLSWEPQPRGLLLSGPSGRGKTRSVWALVKRMAEQGREVRVWHAADLFATLQAQVKYGNDDARGWIESLAKRSVLIIDDLGQESVLAARSDWAQAWFFRLLDIRLGSGLPIVITTNLTADTIAGTTKGIRADPLIRRLLDLCEVLKF